MSHNPIMTKELFILFVYDTQLCQREEDDPQDAVLYFYPNWVTDQQRLALCGQLMGATQFFLTAFSCPRILALSSGKFAIQQYGRYVVAIGTDRNVPDWIIDHRASTLHGLLQLYHCDLDKIATTTVLMETSMSEKLGQIFETFLPIIQYAVDIFGTIPTIRLPKSASNVFLEAIQILHCCQEKKGVLGGVVLYQNRVVATQLCASLTKNLVSTDPYRIKTPAEIITTSFHLPIGVQLIKVYVEHKEFSKLMQEAELARTSYDSVTKQKQKLSRVQTIIGKNPPIPKEQLGGLKRDISRIFTVHEEEGETDLSEEIKIPSVNGINITSNGFTESRSEDFSLNTQCTTPIKDVTLSKVLHEHVVSICRVSESEVKSCQDKTNENHLVEEPALCVKQVTGEKKQVIEKKCNKSEGKLNFLMKHCNGDVRGWHSLTHIPTSVQLSPNRIALKAYSFGLPRLTQNMLEQDVAVTHSDDFLPGKRRLNTIADPYFPVFRSDGLSISRSLYDEQLTTHYKMLSKEKCETATSRKLDLPFIPPIRKDNRVSCKEKQHDTSQHDPVIATDIGTTAKQVSRRSLSLPLKNLTSDSSNCDSNETDVPRKQLAFPPGALESPSVRTRMMGTIPLTPLMSKLTSLALEEKSSGFYSRDTTPSDHREFGTPVETSAANNLSSIPPKIGKPADRSKNVVDTEDKKKAKKPPEDAALYVFGQQSMALLLVLEEKYSSNPELIHSLWETCVGSLNRLEGHLRQCLEPVSQGNETESYSYISLDPRWDMLQRGGPWGCLELDMVTSLHHNFTQSNSLTEIVVRCEDSTVYGYQCGKTEVFYQQSSSATVGLPTPSDLMGVVPLKARRRLERDHGIVLL